MEIYLQLLWNTLTFGLLSSALAASFSQIYAVSRVLHLAHGAVALAAGYIFAVVLRSGAGLIPSMVLGVLSAALLGFLVNEIVYEPMRRRRRISGTAFMVAGLGGLIVLQNTLLAVFSARTWRVPVFFEGVSFYPWGINISMISLIVVFSATAFLIILVLFLRLTRLGLRSRAVAELEELAEIVGVNTRRVRRLAFFAYSAAAGWFGMLGANLFNLEPPQATSYAVDAFAVALTGGLGSAGGAYLSGTALALISNLGGFWFKAVWQNAFVFVAIFLFLFWRPQGLFGRSRQD